jgi:hypothetical protein
MDFKQYSLQVRYHGTVLTEDCLCKKKKTGWKGLTSGKPGEASGGSVVFELFLIQFGTLEIIPTKLLSWEYDTLLFALVPLHVFSGDALMCALHVVTTLLRGLMQIRCTDEFPSLVSCKRYVRRNIFLVIIHNVVF